MHPQMSYYGGAELLIANFSNYLTEKGIKNKILSLNKTEEVEKKIKAEIIVPINNIKISSSGFESLKDLIKGISILRKALKKLYKDYDVINFHNFPATWSLWPRHKPCVWMLNEPPNLWSRPNAGRMLKLGNSVRNKIDKFIVKRIDIICVSDEFNQKRAKDRYGKDARIVNYGIDYDFFSKGKKKNKKFNLKKKFVVLQSGVLSEQKNQLESLKAVNELKSKIKNIILVLAGKENSDYRKILDAYIKENNLEKHVLITGNLAREELRDLYAGADIGLFPIKSQGGWLAPFEMMCNKKTIIFSEEFTASSFVKQNEIGIVTSRYSDAILEYYKNKKKYNKNAKRSALFVKDNLSWSSFGDKMISAFEDAMKN